MPLPAVGPVSCCGKFTKSELACGGRRPSGADSRRGAGVFQLRRRLARAVVFGRYGGQRHRPVLDGVVVVHVGLSVSVAVRGSA